MAIEIKELVVKFTIEQAFKDDLHSKQNKSLSKVMIKDIIDQCTENVLGKISKLEER